MLLERQGFAKAAVANRPAMRVAITFFMMESLVVAVEDGVLAYVLDYLTAAGAGAAPAVAEASFASALARVLGLVVGLGLVAAASVFGTGHFRFRGNDSLGFFRIRFHGRLRFLGVRFHDGFRWAASALAGAAGRQGFGRRLQWRTGRR
jgi:hypothetical protein